jgi:hypothetical protein
LTFVPDGKLRRVNHADELRGRYPTLFRDSPDIDSMQGYGLDLSSYEEVKTRASEIYVCLADGSMPCDEPWHVERLGAPEAMDAQRHGALALRVGCRGHPFAAIGMDLAGLGAARFQAELSRRVGAGHAHTVKVKHTFE